MLEDVEQVAALDVEHDVLEADVALLPELRVLRVLRFKTPGKRVVWVIGVASRNLLNAAAVPALPQKPVGVGDPDDSPYRF
jgi:hypothetical protein